MAVSNTSDCCDFLVKVQRKLACCYDITFETKNSCSISRMVVKDGSGNTYIEWNATALGVPPIGQNTTRTLENICGDDSYGSESYYSVDFYDANGVLVCTKEIEFKCICKCEDTKLDFVLKRTVSTPGQCCFKLYANNNQPCDIYSSSGPYKIIMPIVPGISVTPSSGVTMTTIGSTYVFTNNSGVPYPSSFASHTSTELATICREPGASAILFDLKLMGPSNQLCLQKNLSLECSNIECCDAIEVTLRNPTEQEFLDGKTCCIVTSPTTLCCSPLIIINQKPTPNCPVIGSIGLFKDDALVNGIGIGGGTLQDYIWSPTPCPTSVNTTYVLKFYDMSNNVLCTKSITIPACTSGVVKMGSMEAETGRTEQAIQLSANPNPANQHITLSVENTQATTAVSADIYDMVGNKLITIHEGLLKTGNSTFDIDIATLAIGQYMIKVKTDTGSQTIPFVKQ